MARVQLSVAALEDLDAISASHRLPDEAGARVARSLRSLEQFPLIGRALDGRWEGRRFLIGPWPWMLLIYEFDSDAGVVNVITIQDGRSSSAATSG